MNNLQILIISRLKKKDMTGYAVCKSINTGHSHQQIYREIGKLREAGVITSKVIENKSKPDSNMCHLVDQDEASIELNFSDFSKTNAAIFVDCSDTASHADYVKHMEDAEKSFLAAMGFSYESL